MYVIKITLKKNLNSKAEHCTFAASYKGKDFMTETIKYDTQSAFLVPNIWQDTIPPEFLDLSSEPFDHIDVSAWLNEQSKLRESNICILNNNNIQHHSNVQPPHPHYSYQCFEVDCEANIPPDQGWEISDY